MGAISFLLLREVQHGRKEKDKLGRNEEDQRRLHVMGKNVQNMRRSY
jgi:hypothetical protein